MTSTLSSVLRIFSTNRAKSHSSVSTRTWFDFIGRLHDTPTGQRSTGRLRITISKSKAPFTLMRFKSCFSAVLRIILSAEDWLSCGKSYIFNVVNTVPSWSSRYVSSFLQFSAAAELRLKLHKCEKGITPMLSLSPKFHDPVVHPILSAQLACRPDDRSPLYWLVFVVLRHTASLFMLSHWQRSRLRLEFKAETLSLNFKTPKKSWKCYFTETRRRLFKSLEFYNELDTFGRQMEAD